ncbi:hypothetical protein [Humisphaera borealis]|uniref:Uncharacterized protein n=1 Tax=Humisphaera borealis TaxID=2807512 RepID=A0A7M2X014_9BACT|nr:hypothetical protein [Humisphaera borealis]QOV90993.1 hypothetical protein IPV69_06440 [Humisphaera borealis]
MTKLREQLRDARIAYESASYPGDLAGDVLSKRTGRFWTLFPAVLGGALAASIALTIGFLPGSPSATPTETASFPNVQPARPTPAASFTFPDRMPLTLPTSPLLAASVPVTVSWVELNDLGQQQYQQIAPKVRQHLSSWPSLSPQKPVESNATTQRAV